jgi:iron complex outermembrane recepter protein
MRQGERRHHCGRFREAARHSLVVALFAAATCSHAFAQEAPSAGSGTNAVSLPEIKVIATTPLAPSRPTARPAAARAATPVAAATAASAASETAAKAVPGAVELDKIPSNVVTIGASAFDGTKAPDLLQSLDRALPGVSLSSQTGNDFQLDLNYRGFTASPVIGTPQGLAVYQNGVRINESNSLVDENCTRPRSARA